MTPEESWSKIWKAFEKCQWAQLLELCAVFEKELPDYPYTRLIHARALAKLKRFTEAEAMLRELQSDPHVSSSLRYACLVDQGEISEDTGKFDDARKAYESAHRLCPNKMQPLIYRGVVDLKTGNFGAAREWLNQALSCSSGVHEEAHLNIGNTYLAQQNYTKAIEHYQKAITIDPDYDAAWEQLADAKHALEIRGEADVGRS
jgi:tetratricopeptide (TPR) repeat protein